MTFCFRYRNFLGHVLKTLACLTIASVASAGAETPELLAEAFKAWSQGKDDLSFVLRTRYLNDDGSLKAERVERYDPSLPDARRWALLEVDGRAPTASDRAKIQDRRNKKPRKKLTKPLDEYFDLENARVVGTENQTVRYEVPVRPEAARAIPVEKVTIGIFVSKESKTIDRVTADLNEPMRIALGIAKVTDLDLDLRFDSEEDDGSDGSAGGKASEADGTARVVMSKFGNRAEYTWGEFKRVERHPDGAKSKGAGASVDEIVLDK
jgi:hypothetical protein